MSITNIDAIYAEYPFLELIVPRASTTSAQVALWDSEFASRSSQTDRSDWHHFLLLDARGQIVTRVGENSSFLGKLSRSLKRENLAQALYRLADRARTVRYSLIYTYGSIYDYFWEVDRVDRRYADLFFYKLPGDYENAADWLANEIKDIRKEIRQL